MLSVRGAGCSTLSALEKKEAEIAEREGRRFRERGE